MTGKLVVLSTLFITQTFAIDWKPVSQEERELKTPKIDKSADAEVLFWDVYISDTIRSFPYTEHATQHYMRIKIFNDRGAEAQGKVVIPYASLDKATISGVLGRTIKPDGSIVELKPDQVFDSMVAKFGKGTKIKAKTFSLPGVTPGSIIEYQWKEVLNERIPRYIRQDVQREIPVWKMDLFVKPLTHEAFRERMNAYAFNVQIQPWAQIRMPDDWVHTSAANIPALVEEREAPSDDELKGWILLYYTTQERRELDKYWTSLGKELQGDFKRQIKVNDAVKTLASAATEGVSGDEEKLQKLADFCRAHIKNIRFETAGITAEDRSNYSAKEDRTSADTAKQKIGAPSDINVLFAAMAQASGFEVHGARASSALSAYFRKDLLDPFLLRDELVAVKVKAGWRFYDPGHPYVPSGMVRWDAEGQKAIILDDKDPVITIIPPSKPEQNSIQRTAQLKLNRDGSVEGQVTMIYEGQEGVDLKDRLESISEAKREDEFQEILKEVHGDAEITAIKVANVTDPLKPLTLTYSIKVENYGQTTGKRLFFQPNFFTHGAAPRFTANDRHNRIAFRYGFAEMDHVTMELPEGTMLENAELPGNLSIGDVGDLKIEMRVQQDSKLILDRQLVWGRGGKIFFRQQDYGVLKQIWDGIQKRDIQAMSVREQ